MYALFVSYEPFQPIFEKYYPYHLTFFHEIDTPVLKMNENPRRFKSLQSCKPYDNHGKVDRRWRFSTIKDIVISLQLLRGISY